MYVGRLDFDILDGMETEDFQEIVWQYFRDYGRTHLPWRQRPTPYHVLVSELMLQQTQVERVVPKFIEFTGRFPNVKALAEASLADVLAAWQGLGYNRRAKYLHEAAKNIVRRGNFPNTVDELQTLPGVGLNTAGAIMAYAYDRPVAFVETNIRTVYIHHFFSDKQLVADAEILERVNETLPDQSIREWYSALMDYGTYLKQQGNGRLHIAKNHKKQSTFEGSLRQMRGAIIRALSDQEMDEVALRLSVHADKRFNPAFAQLQREGLVTKTKTGYCLGGK